MRLRARMRLRQQLTGHGPGGGGAVGRAPSSAEPAGRPFLTAKWLNVAAVTFAVEQGRLLPYLPPGASIDTLDGSPRLSLVAFEFAETRVRGLAIPMHVRFPEINLRFYVRFGGQRGVVFIRELVPRRAIATIARLVYNEPYVRVPMTCGVEPLPGSDGIRVWHRFGADSSLRMDGSGAATLPAVESAGHWLTDHSLGVGRRRDGRAVLYHVGHPIWPLREVTAVALDVDFTALYGPSWRWLEDATPSHLSLATGSSVRVSRPIDA